MTDDPTRAERQAMDWWNALTERERVALMKAADTVLVAPSAAEAWNLRIEGVIEGPPLPAGAERVHISKPSPTRDGLQDFHCPFCRGFLGRGSRALPGSTWCDSCRVSVSYKPFPREATA